MLTSPPVTWPPVTSPPPFIGASVHFELAGRTALVTGATTGVGRAFARMLADRGSHVFLVDDDLPALRETAAGLEAGSRSLVLRCDLGSVDDVLAVGDFLHRTAAPLSLVVHAASEDRPGLVTTTDVDVLDEHYLMAVRGPYLLCQQVLGQLSRNARMVFIDQKVDSRSDDAHAAMFARRGPPWWITCAERRRCDGCPSCRCATTATPRSTRWRRRRSRRWSGRAAPTSWTSRWPAAHQPSDRDAAAVASADGQGLHETGLQLPGLGAGDLRLVDVTGLDRSHRRRSRSGQRALSDPRRWPAGTVGVDGE